MRILVCWLLIAAALYVGWWGMIGLPASALSPARFAGILATAAPFYLPVFAVAAAVPAALHLFAGRLAATWSWLALAGSISVPIVLLLLIRTSYVNQTARGMHVEGKGLWGAFAIVALIGLYGASCALTFAIAAARGAGAARSRSRAPLIALSAAALLLYAAIAVSQFWPFFVFVYP